MQSKVNNNKHLFKDKSNFPLCLQQAKFVTPDQYRYIYGVPILSLQTSEHRVSVYFKPVSKLF
jgi:hypothetical protein